MIKQRFLKIKNKEFFGFIFRGFNLKPTFGMKTLGVDDDFNLYYDPDFILQQDDAKLSKLIDHEMCHIVAKHVLVNEKDKKQHMLNNIAMDIKVNKMIGIDWQDSMHCDHRGDFNYDGQTTNIQDVERKTWSEIKKIIKPMFKNKQPPNNPAHNKWGTGQGNNKGSKNKTNQNNQKINGMIAQAQGAGKGNIPGEIQRLIKDIFNPKVPWEIMLFKTIGEMISGDYSFSRPSKKGMANGIYLPGPAKEGFKMVAHIDTSGSIGKEEFAKFVSEVIGAKAMYPQMECHLIVCDHALRAVYSDEDFSSVRFDGGGGTSHEPVIKHIMEELPDTDILVSFTDGCSDVEEVWEKYHPQFKTYFVGTRVENVCSNYGEILLI